MQPFYQNPLIGNVPYFVQLNHIGNFPPHWHGEIELYYVIHGKIEVVVNGQTRVLTDRMMTVVGSAEVHSLNPTLEDPLFIVAEMGYELLGEGFDRLVGRDFSNLVLDFAQSPSSQLEDTLDQLYDILNNDNIDPVIRDFTNRSLLCRCAAMLLQMTPDIKLSERRRKQVGDLLAMQKVLQIVSSRYAENLTVEEAAAISGYEKTRFCQLFGYSIGMPFHKYLNRCRVNAAKHLLSSTDRPIRGIGEEVGLPEPKTFSRVFRAYTGSTPSEWRRKSDEGKT